MGSEMCIRDRSKALAFDVWNKCLDSGIYLKPFYIIGTEVMQEGSSILPFNGDDCLTVSSPDRRQFKWSGHSVGFLVPVYSTVARGASPTIVMESAELIKLLT